MNLRDAWEREAANWLAWAREPGHDSYWTFHRDAFLDLLPPSAGLTVDVGCGEGRLPRDLKAHGYEVVGVDASAALIHHARRADVDGDYRVADAAALPLPDASASLAIAFMSLHDVDDLESAVREIARVMQPDGVLAAAIVSPINSAGTFLSKDDDAAFHIEKYLDEWEDERLGDKNDRDSVDHLADAVEEDDPLRIQHATLGPLHEEPVSGADQSVGGDPFAPRSP